MQSDNPNDLAGVWPEREWEALARAGGTRWAIPTDCGGDGLSALDLHLRYESLASHSLGVALILTQRDSAAGFIEAAERFAPRDELLRKLAADEQFTTVGIAQLTTSHQRGAPALRAVPAPGGYRIDGFIPWCTGADQADYIIAGAATEDGGRLLFLLHTDLPGVTVEAPRPLVALRHTHTCPVHCEGCVVDPAFVLRGPAPDVLTHRRRSLPLGQAFLALGLCRAGLGLIDLLDSAPALAASERLARQLGDLRKEVLDLSAEGRESEARDAAPRLRAAVNDLALRVTHTAVALHKGAALQTGHPAQRLAREALFLLVWSCPDPVIDCTVDVLSQADA